VAFGRDRRGGALIDFSLVAPALLLLIIGLFEFAMVATGNAMLQSAVSEAARAGITGSIPEGSTREEMIRQVIHNRGSGLLRADDIEIDTLVYGSFDSIGTAEPFTDTNGNGVYDPGEPFTDVNGNGQWDEDQGRPGLGGANDIVLYRVRYPWRMATPLMRHVLPGGGALELEAVMAVRNEPFPEDD
jgi:hypothetical protein